MRRLLMTTGALLSLCFLGGPAGAVEYKWTGEGFVTVNSTTDAYAPSAASTGVTKPSAVRSGAARFVYRDIVIPPGHHAHDLAGIFSPEGRQVKIVHSSTNLNDANAHAGVARPWYQTGKPGDIVTIREYIAETIPAEVTTPVVTDALTSSFQMQYTAAPTRYSNCPNGNCPTSTRTTSGTVLTYNGVQQVSAPTLQQSSSFQSSYSASSSYSARSSYRVGPMRRLFGVRFRGGCR